MKYIDKPEIEVEVGKLEIPSGPILHSGTIYNEEYIEFFYNCIINEELYYVNYDENG